MSSRKCDKFVLKKKGWWGYKIYVREDSAKRAGARKCGGQLRIERMYEHLHSIISGSETAEFYGKYEVKCSRCGHVHEVVESDIVEQLVERYVMGTL